MGTTNGRGKRLTSEDRKKIIRLKNRGLTVAEIAQRLKIPNRTVYRWFNRQTTTENARRKCDLNRREQQVLVEVARLLRISGERLQRVLAKIMPDSNFKPVVNAEQTEDSDNKGPLSLRWRVSSRTIRRIADKHLFGGAQQNGEIEENQENELVDKF